MIKGCSTMYAIGIFEIRTLVMQRACSAAYLRSLYMLNKNHLLRATFSQLSMIVLRLWRLWLIPTLESTDSVIHTQGYTSIKCDCMKHVQ